MKGAPRGTICFCWRPQPRPAGACQDHAAGCSAVTGPSSRYLRSSTLLRLARGEKSPLNSVSEWAVCRRDTGAGQRKKVPAGCKPVGRGCRAQACEAWMFLMVLAVHLAVAATA